MHRRADLPEADKRHLEYVISEVSRINDLITEFLDFAKLQRAAARIATGARAGGGDPRLLQPGTGHKIDAHIDDQAPGATIYADAKQLKQACLNLILNAIDANYDIICKKYSKGEVCDMETIDIYDYMYWGDYNAKIKELAEKALLRNGVLKTKMTILF